MKEKEQTDKVDYKWKKRKGTEEGKMKRGIEETKEEKRINEINEGEK